MTCETIGCPELRLRHSPASDLAMVGEAIGQAVRSLLWTLPPARHPSEFRVHGARLR